MREDGGGGEGFLEEVEGRAALMIENPGDTLSDEVYEGHNYLGVLMDETLIEVGETEEGLHVLSLARLRPILNSFDLLRGHLQSRWREDIAEALSGISVEFALLSVHEEAIIMQPVQDFLHMFLMGCFVLGVDEDIV